MDKEQLKWLKKAFGEGTVEANLGNLMKPKSIFGRSRVHPKMGAEYMYDHCEFAPQKWLLDRGFSFGWIRLKCTYRRSGAYFLHICDDKTQHEEVFFDDSIFTRMLYPVDLDLAAFKFNKDFDFVLKLAPGQVIKRS